MPADEKIKRLVVQRASNRCEYCGIHQEDDPVFRFPIDRIIGGQHGGIYSEENTALACHNCNQKKGPNIASVVPEAQGTIVPLFNPRKDVWSEHFELLSDSVILGRTPTGKATVLLLDMNTPNKVHLRSLASSNQRL